MAAVTGPLRDVDLRFPLVWDAAVATGAALLAAVAVADGSLDATMWPDVPAAPAAVPGLLVAALAVPLVWRRTHPLAALGTIVVACDLVMWWGLDHPVVLSALVAAYSAGVRARPSRLLAAGGGLVAGLAASAGRWGAVDVLDAYLLLAVLAAAAALAGITVRTHRASRARLAEARDRQTRLAAAADRARIAREVHDIVAHNLAVMVTLADGAVYSLDHAPRRAGELMEKVSATGREALGDMRRLIALLRDGASDPDTGDGATPSPPSRPQPGFSDIDQLIEDVRHAGMRIDLTRTGEPGAWGPSAGLTVYRIVQEALTNTVKHAGPRAAGHVRLAFTTTGVDVEITDDGAGQPVRPTPSQPTGNHGLAGMAERVAVYGGRLEAGPRSGGSGWRVHARLRLDPSAA